MKMIVFAAPDFNLNIYKNLKCQWCASTVKPLKQLLKLEGYYVDMEEGERAITRWLTPSMLLENALDTLLSQR